jgi:3-hydroxybutyryl-CoA dehydrogenase
LPLTVAIIGAGPLGRWLALAAARAGYRVLLEDVMPGNLHHAREEIRRQLNAETLPSVTFAASIEDAVREADLAIDWVPDELESKLEILWLLDRMAPPRTIFATPTTRLAIDDLAQCVYRPDKLIAIAAEPQSLATGAVGSLLLRAAKATSAETVALVERFWTSLGFATSVDACS